MEDANLEIADVGIVLRGKNGERAVFTWETLFVVILARVASGLVKVAHVEARNEEAE